MVVCFVSDQMTLVYWMKCVTGSQFIFVWFIFVCLFVFRPTGGTQDIRLKLSTPRTRDNSTYCRAFGSGALTACVYDLVRSRLGWERQTFRLRGERSNCKTFNHFFSFKMKDSFYLFYTNYSLNTGNSNWLLTYKKVFTGFDIFLF